MNAGLTSERLVLLFPGFEAMPIEAHCRRFIREARKTATAYDFALPRDIEVTVTPGEDGITIGQFEVTASGDGWTTATQIVAYGLEGLNSSYSARNPLTRLASGLVALGDFFVTGTVLRYLWTSWRYALFVFYPIVILGTVLLASLLTFSLLASLGSGILAALFGALAIAVVMLWGASRWMHLLLIMDDWTLARDIARDKRSDIKACQIAIARDAVARIANAGGREVVLAAHSLGAVTAVPVLAALCAERSIAGPFGFLTVGSSLLKVALHPAASALRDDVTAVARGDTVWLDVQSLTDPMNFYNSEPIRSLGIEDAPPANTMHVRFRQHLKRETYNRIRRNFFRIHRQFVYGVERRGRYAFHGILCGPMPFAAVASRPGLPKEGFPAKDLAGRPEAKPA